ncbi:MAG TPA: hypothetical protein VL137_01830 [Polyangiaceae bacterium]|nr:hypothetical protein [Polyangiaceae bacterium]
MANNESGGGQSGTDLNTASSHAAGAAGTGSSMGGSAMGGSSMGGSSMGGSAMGGASMGGSPMGEMSDASMGGDAGVALAVVPAPNYEVTGTWPNKPVAIQQMPGTLTFTKKVIHSQFLAESCAIGDYNNDLHRLEGRSSGFPRWVTA